MKAYNPKTLSIEPSANIVVFGPRIEDRKMVLVIGAGVSMAPEAILTLVTR